MAMLPRADSADSAAGPRSTSAGGAVPNSSGRCGARLVLALLDPGERQSFGNEGRRQIGHFAERARQHR